MTNAELHDTIREAYFALAGSRSPSLRPEQQKAELAKCHDLLAAVVYAPTETGTESAAQGQT